MGCSQACQPTGRVDVDSVPRADCNVQPVCAPSNSTTRLRKWQKTKFRPIVASTRNNLPRARRGLQQSKSTVVANRDAQHIRLPCHAPGGPMPRMQGPSRPRKRLLDPDHPVRGGGGRVTAHSQDRFRRRGGAPIHKPQGGEHSAEGEGAIVRNQHLRQGARVPKDKLEHLANATPNQPRHPGLRRSQLQRLHRHPLLLHILAGCNEPLTQGL
mmetsp:Transcript_103934/g.237939  ORF Transcript_103934/g.237939 Transcript_103934/m.237939 type:complete len:213 (+) Transcript_103934:786-1424(+)